MHADRVVAACWAFLLATAPPAMAGPDSSGSIAGTVTDQQRAVVPEAAIRARNVVTDVQFTTSTNNRGFFWFPEVPVGTYELQVVKNGFASWIQKDVIVNVGARVTVRAELKTATVEVAFEVRPPLKPLLESTRSQVSTTIDERAVADLPVNGRNFLDLILLTPGATTDPRGAIIFAGQRKAFGVVVDGGENNDTYFGDPMGNGDRPQYSLDAIGEFQVNTSSYSAELGHTGGGLVNVVTKSGGNAFHGSAFAYYRDKSLNAIDLINKLAGQPKSPYNFTQFGGTFGGPVRRNRLFVFGDYEGQQSRTENVVELNVPARFTQSSDPIVNDFQQRAVDYLRARASSWIRTADQHLMFVKGDWSFGSSSLLTVRANRQRFTGEGGESPGGPQVSSEHTGTSLIDRDTFGGALTSVISSSWLNVARVSRVESRILGRPNTANAEASVFESGQLALTIGRIPIDPREIAIRRFEWSDTLSHRRGSHLLKIGLTGLQDEITFRTAVNFSGTYQFASLESFGRSLAESPLPLPSERYIQAFSGVGTPGVSVYPDRVDFTAFVQDEWRVTPALTVNAGVRDDVEALARPPVRNPSPALAAAGLDTSFVPRRRNYVAPRIGVAWTPAASDRLVLRGGYGMFYGRTLSLMSARAHFQNGVTVATRTFSGTGPTAALIPAYPNSSCGPPDSSGTPPSCAAPGIGAPSILMLFDRSYVAPLFHQASSGLDLKIHQDTIFSLSYLLARGVQLTRLRDVNLGASTTATITRADTGIVYPYSRFSTRPIAEFDRVYVFESRASSTYHALALQVSRRLASGVQFLGSYTLSKVDDDFPDAAPINPPTNDAQLLSDATHPERDWASGNADQRHRLVFSGLLDLQSIGWRPQGVGAILADWKLSGILRAQSGQPYSGVLNFDLNNDGNRATDRAPGVTRNTFRLPANVAVDVRVTRAFPLGNGHRRLELSWDAFNLFNRANIVTVERQQFIVRNGAECGVGVPQCLVPNRSGPTAFGTPTETAGPRIMQLAARFIF